MAAHEPVGTLAEEAAKLISALQGWAADHRGPGAPTADSADADAPDAASDEYDAEASQHESHGSAECRYCPLCNVARLAKAASPEVRDHLSSAALSMALAVKGLLEGFDREQHESRREPVEKIDLLED